MPVYMPQQRPGAIQQSLGMLQAGNAAMGMKNQLSQPDAPTQTPQPGAGNVGDSSGLGLADQNQQTGMQSALNRRSLRGQGQTQGGY